MFGRQNLIELGLGLFFECVNLFPLIGREMQLLGLETREQMKPSTRTTRASLTARTTGAILSRRAAVTAAVRTVRRTILGTRAHGKGGNRNDAENCNKRWKPSHGNLLIKRIV